MSSSPQISSAALMAAFPKPMGRRVKSNSNLDGTSVTVRMVPSTEPIVFLTEPAPTPTRHERRKYISHGFNGRTGTFSGAHNRNIKQEDDAPLDCPGLDHTHAFAEEPVRPTTSQP
jgi:hypothetical protein